MRQRKLLARLTAIIALLVVLGMLIVSSGMLSLLDPVPPAEPGLQSAPGNPGLFDQLSALG